MRKRSLCSAPSSTRTLRVTSDPLVLRDPAAPGRGATRRAALPTLALALGAFVGCGGARGDDSPSPAGEVGAARQALGPTPCSDAQRAALLTPSTTRFDLHCSITLAPGEVIRRPLHFDGDSDGVILDCSDQDRDRGDDGRVLVPSISFFTEVDGAVEPALRLESMIFDFPNTGDGYYIGDRLENVTIRNCTVEGQTRVHATRMWTGGSRWTVLSSHNFDWPDGADTSVAGHVARVRTIAPTNVRFENVDLIAKGATPIYLGPGVSRFHLEDSTVRGAVSRGPGIYFDAESYENTILNSTLMVETSSREQLAIDASSYNFIAGNRISGLNHGGIHLYRNCGEDGGIRYTPPSYNIVVNNRFVYRNFVQPILPALREYAVHLSSRNGPASWSNNYCGDDLWPSEDFIYPWGIDSSYVTSRDNAQYNLVTNNQFLDRYPGDYIRDSSGNGTNVVGGNRGVDDFVIEPSPCYSRFSAGRLLDHGRTESTLITVAGIPTCLQYTCNDGTLEFDTCDIPPVDEGIDFECQATGDNGGCDRFIPCPDGKYMAAVTAACNLELGRVTEDELASVPQGVLSVVRASDVVSDGRCYVLGTGIASGSTTVPVPPGIIGLNFGCRERDSNGGDCHIVGKFYCE